MAATHEDLQRIADFGHPFMVTVDGDLVDALADVYAPEVFHDDVSDIQVGGHGWTPLRGYTGQHGYRGPVMHPSEYLGGRLADDILATPGVYVVCAVDVLDGEDSEPAGWAVLRRDS